ncbi:hypothetical protein HOT31_gp092 [Microbacterium phage Hendrix]|uniref:Uncharacterized protein n=1 Tax=Microbacterium phage Hendrix TaxID=2182341 RepID=A0A2U8UUL4_9CAUD|nr:hypothetical protein HOT31_gp092 [Microbacterium phage Hendrix]AWN07763.2 hypothetical protein PBI_HENDRIX_92 [Microbacterium phage Hendrix]
MDVIRATLVLQERRAFRVGKNTMALDLQGSATSLKKREKGKRIKCSDCGETVKLKKEMVEQDGKKYHLVCAGFIHAPKLAPCPDCFMVAPCFCVGT